MNKKVSFSQSPAYLTKVKKEQPKKAAKPSSSDSVYEQRHEKINFKQYLRDLDEQQNSDDEYSDIPLLTTTIATLEGVRQADDSLIENLRCFDLGGDDATIKIYQEDWNLISELNKDESMSIVDSRNDRIFITRSLSNHLVIECQDYGFNGRLKFDDVIKKLK